MPAPNEKLAAPLAALLQLQDQGRFVFRSSEFTRVHRERLIRGGFLRTVLNGWLISSSPDAGPYDSSPWFASFWEFCAAYCNCRFGQDWYLSPELSLLLCADNTTIPRRVIIHTPHGTNNRVDLPFGTSLYDLRRQGMVPEADLAVQDGLRRLVPEAALVKVPAAFFAGHATEARVALTGIRHARSLLERLLDGGHSVVAGRLAGAFRRVGRSELADEILGVMRRTGYDIRENDPFEPGQAFGVPLPAKAPITARLHSLWDQMRGPVIAAFPETPGLPGDTGAYLASIDGIYGDDAYHSLSIEGYRVTPELIDYVRSSNWDHENTANGRSNQHALAARGYWQAFQLVRTAVSKIIDGAEPSALIREPHHDWYAELFQPGVAAGLFAPSAMVGYRGHPVYLRGSRHVPPRWESVRDAMPALFELLEAETEPSVQAVLGHWLFGYVHPYPDGNGRMARFVMNALLASGGYPWTVIRVEDRAAYLAALEAASVDQDIGPFARFVAERVQRPLERRP